MGTRAPTLLSAAEGTEHNCRMAVIRLDHFAVAVRDPGPAVQLYGELLGGRYVQGVSDWRGFGFIQFEYPNGSRLEVIFPGPEKDGFLPKFLERHGEGMHHMTFLVDDLRAEVDRLRSAGHRVVDEDYSDSNWQDAFLSPLTAHGTITQLAQSTLSQAEQDARWGERLERILEVAAGG